MNNTTNAIAFGGDEQFIRELTKYLTPNDINQICESYNKPITNTNINPRTGRVRIGVPKTRPRKILRNDTLRNYKSVILRFCKFKLEKFGRDSPITREIIEKFNAEKIVNGRNKRHTMNTITNILNKYIVVPITGEELPKPMAIKSLTGNYFSNKPKFMHIEIALAVLRMYKTCKNRDHVHKILLLYYTGLRSSEASSLTFNDIIDGYSKRSVVIPVRMGKGRQIRNVVIFHGGPMVYYKEYFIPYIISKLEMLLSMRKDGEIDDDLLNVKIFSNSNYHACIKSFKKRLDWAVRKLKNLGVGKDDEINEEEEDDEDDDEDDDDESLKGSGLHSLRADWATRTIKLLFSINKNPVIAVNMTARLLGHRSDNKLINKHYINLGDGFEENNLDKIKDLLEDECKDISLVERCDNFNILKFQKEKVSSLFKNKGRIIKELLNRKKNRNSNYNITRLFKVTDNSYLFPSKSTNTATIFNELNNNDDDELLLSSHEIEESEGNDDNNNNNEVDLVGNFIII